MQLRPGETANDAWFAEQRDAFERGEENWLEHEESGTAVAAAMRNLRGAWLSNAREYVGAAVGPDAGEAGGTTLQTLSESDPSDATSARRGPESRPAAGPTAAAG